MNYFSKITIHKSILLTCITLLFVAGGCKSPSDSNTEPRSNVKLQQTTVGDVVLNPAQPIPGLEILIPEGFDEMGQAVIATKYPATNRPTLVYTNDAGSINVAINHTQNKIAPNQLNQLHVQLDNSIRQSQPNTNWRFSGFQHYHGRKWIQLEFQSNAIDTKIHNLMIATSAQGRMLVVSFNCTDEHAGKWFEVGREIVKSAIFTE